MKLESEETMSTTKRTIYAWGLLLASVCVGALMMAGYEYQRVQEVERQLSRARYEAAQQENQLSSLQGKIGPLQAQVEILQMRKDGSGQSAEKVNPAGAADNPDGTAGAKPDDGNLIPASQIAATRRLTPISAEELAQRVQDAYQRTPETLAPVTMTDMANIPNDFEFGSGDGRRMWHMVDSSTYDEVYPDGAYSVFTVLGHTTVNGVPGVIAAKDDGLLDAFVPDKGGSTEFMIRGSTPQAQWVNYSGMQNIQ